jgi:flagellar assembly factor FliW
VRVLNLVTVRSAEQRAPLTVNLRAPIIIDVRRRQMFQTILSDQRWPISAPVITAGNITATDTAAIDTVDGV